jgi:hypothetical protein
MRKTIIGLGALVTLIAALAAPGRTAETVRARDILPAEGLVSASVAAIRDQADLNAHYYLADEAVLGLGRKTDAVLARYRTETGEALLLVVAYPSAVEAGRVYGRFGGDFFSETFDPMSPRVVEMIETGDWAGAARKGRFLIVVLESPDKAACDGLLQRAEDKVPASPAK